MKKKKTFPLILQPLAMLESLPCQLDFPFFFFPQAL